LISGAAPLGPSEARRLQVPKGYPRDMAPPLPEEIRHLIDVNIHPPPSLEITLPVSLYISLGLYINKFLILLTNIIFIYIIGLGIY
jgi:hypothetical protein